MFKYVTLIAACPVKGQVRRECAAHPSCHQTCNNTNDQIACPLVCIVGGCECPNGTVINEDTNECVAPSECEGTQYNYYYISVVQIEKVYTDKIAN